MKNHRRLAKGPMAGILPRTCFTNRTSTLMTQTSTERVSSINTSAVPANSSQQTQQQQQSKQIATPTAIASNQVVSSEQPKSNPPPTVVASKTGNNVPAVQPQQSPAPIKTTTTASPLPSPVVRPSASEITAPPPKTTPVSTAAAPSATAPQQSVKAETADEAAVPPKAPQTTQADSSDESEDAAPPGVASSTNQLATFKLAAMKVRASTSSPGIVPASVPAMEKGENTNGHDSDDSDAPPGLEGAPPPGIAGSVRVNTPAVTSQIGSKQYSRLELISVFSEMIKLTGASRSNSIIVCVPRNSSGAGTGSMMVGGNRGMMNSGRQTPLPFQQSRSGFGNASARSKEMTRHGFGTKMSASGVRSRLGKDKDPLHRDIMSLLNKLTVEKFERVAEQLAVLAETLTTPAQLKTLVELIFEKAVSEPGFDFLNADLCIVVAARSPQFEITMLNGEIKKINFQKQFVNTIQDAFEKSVPDVFEVSEEEREGLSEADIEVKFVLMKKRMLGTMNFIGHMLLRNLISHKVILGIVPALLSPPSGKVPSSNKLEACCELIRQVGRYIELQDEAALLSWVERLEDILPHFKEHDLKVYFCMKNLLELRQNCWMELARGDQATTLKNVERRHLKESNQKGGQLAAFERGELRIVGELLPQPYQPIIEKHRTLLNQRKTSEGDFKIIACTEADLVAAVSIPPTLVVASAQFGADMNGQIKSSSPLMMPAAMADKEDRGDDDSSSLHSVVSGSDYSDNEEDRIVHESVDAVENEIVEENSAPLTSVLGPQEDILSVPLLSSLNDYFQTSIMKNNDRLSDEQINQWISLWSSHLPVKSSAGDAFFRQTRQCIALIRMGADLSAKKNIASNIHDLLMSLVTKKVVILRAMYRAVAVWLACSRSIDAPRAETWVYRLAMMLFSRTTGKGSEGDDDLDDENDCDVEHCNIKYGVWVDKPLVEKMGDVLFSSDVIVRLLTIKTFGLSQVVVFIVRLFQECPQLLKVEDQDPLSLNCGENCIKKLESFLEESLEDPSLEEDANDERLDLIANAIDEIIGPFKAATLFSDEEWENAFQKHSFSPLWSSIKSIDEVLGRLRIKDDELEFLEEYDFVLSNVLGLACEEFNKKNMPKEKENRSNLIADFSKKLTSNVLPLITAAANFSNLGLVTCQARLSILASFAMWFFNFPAEVADVVTDSLKIGGALPIKYKTVPGAEGDKKEKSICWIDADALVSRKI
eukprot:GDKJ01046796.1.p1 GENE.GDKJ01046796.1~~GDKJ01046796.1.p1  ORF type:complete len:1410 (-),score=488.34 GDKJ01046796.1:343-4002(-)